MKKSVPFRTWFYFRLGWSTYFAFVFAAINTLTVTYFLAIDNYPVLSQIFPTFQHYIFTLSVTGVPLLILIGYIHYKKSPAYRSEADVVIESNPHMRRMMTNSETMLGLSLQLLYLITKISNNEKLTETEKTSLSKLQKDLEDYMKKRSTTSVSTIFDSDND